LAELLELLDDRLADEVVAPDALAPAGGRLPRGLVDEDRVPADLPLES
jgi:hypothetical protein